MVLQWKPFRSVFYMKSPSALVMLQVPEVNTSWWCGLVFNEMRKCRQLHKWIDKTLYFLPSKGDHLRLLIFVLILGRMPVSFDCIIKRFEKQGEKTGWTYIEIPSTIADKIKAGTKKSFRVKGTIDGHAIEKASLLPMGDGGFILPLNKAMQTGIKKPIGAKVKVQFAEDVRQIEIDKELVACLKDEPEAYKKFSKMPPSHQRYYSKWITNAKTRETKAKRIAKTVNGMIKNESFGDTLKSLDD